MFRTRIVTRITTLFVVAFICLNAGGAVCVAYCQTFDIDAETEHCPLQKASEHCNKARQKDSKVIGTPTSEMDCCPFTISFVAAPVEKPSLSLDAVAASASPEAQVSPVLLGGHKRSVIGIIYRGPPMDRRIDRLKRCIIRI